MNLIIELIETSFLLWVYIETAWLLIINFVYLTIPWFVWPIAVIIVLIRFGTRIPPVDPKVVKKVLGIDPVQFNIQDDSLLEEISDDDYCMRVIAHRAAGYDFPENSMTALHMSQERGCDAVEVDISLTKDNIPVLFHDMTIDRMTGISGRIEDMTWDELKDLDISATHPLRVKLNPEGEKIAQLEEGIVTALGNHQRLFLDIKAEGNVIVNIIVDLFKKYPQLYEYASVTSFNPMTIYLIRKKDPAIIGGLTWRPQCFSKKMYNGFEGPHQPRYDNFINSTKSRLIDLVNDWAFNHLTYYILGLSYVMLHKDLVNSDVIRRWNQRGVRVFVWTLNLPIEKKYFTRNLRVTYLTDTLLS